MDPLIIAIGLYFVAILLAVIDIFVPSGGVLMILSGIAAAASILLGFRAGVTPGLVISIIVMATIPVFIYSAIRLWPHTSIGRRILLLPPNAPISPSHERLLNLVGLVVINRWQLAPMGQVKIGSQRYSAKSFGSRVIDIGKRIKIVDIHEGILVVAETNDPLSETPVSQGKQPSMLDASSPADEDLLETPAQQLGLGDLDELPLDALPLDEGRQQ